MSVERRQDRLRIADVARHASVSTATVSRVLNGDSTVGAEYRERVARAASDLGYRPNRLARNLRRQRSGAIGVVVADIENEHFSTMIRAIEDAAYADGYHVLVCSTDESREKQDAYLQALADERVLGVIVSPSWPASPAIGDLIDAGISVVALDRSVEDPRVDAVLADNFAGARAATELLIESGHDSIALVAGASDVDTGLGRRAGYEAAMQRRGLGCRVIQGGFRAREARSAVSGLLDESDRPSALFVANNLMVLGVLHAVRDHGMVVPRDLAIVGFDEPMWADLIDPPITTVVQPVRRMALDAFELLKRRLSEPRSAPRTIVHPLDLRVRSSHQR